MTNKILFVDDEKDILSSMRRLFMEDRYEILTAESGIEALELLRKGPVDLIVSDQKMPKMTGVEFLQRSKEYSPDSIRILLTGYADINAAIDSINKGNVYRYITKPWNNDELRSTIRNALEFSRLRKENENLLQLTQKQNLELKDFNENLEEKVKAQTKEIRTMYEKLNRSFMNTVKVLSSIVILKEGARSLSLPNASKLTKAIAQDLGLSETEVKDIEIATLLRDIGKIGITDAVLKMSFAYMNTHERMLYMKHPILGQAALQSIETMQEVSNIVRHHHERWDGKGYPDKLSDKQIPIGSKIVSIVSDYCELMNGFLMPSKFTSKEAKKFVRESSGYRYDPEIVALFISKLETQEKRDEELSEFKVSSSELKSGMVLTKNMYTKGGLLLLGEGLKLSEAHINKIANFEKSEGIKYQIIVTLNS